MSPQFYHLIHIVGLFCLIAGTIGMLIYKSQSQNLDAIKVPKGFAALHGIGLLATLVAGFGLLAKLQIGFEPWVFIKLVIWLLLGLMPIIYRFTGFRTSLILTIVLPSIAAATVILK